MNIPEKIVVEYTLSHYEMSGDVDVTLWGGGQAGICMKTTKIPLSVDVENDIELSKYVNDSGFGVQSIDHAYVDIEAIYITGESLEDYHYIKKRIHSFDFKVTRYL